MRNDSLFLHLALAAAISFGISVYAWLGLGVFLPVPFWAVSSGVALAATVIGWMAGRRLLVTAAAAFLARTAFLAMALSG